MTRGWGIAVAGIALAASLQGCATSVALGIWKEHPFLREREVRFQGLDEAPRVVPAHLVGWRPGATVEGVWKLDGAPVWLRESTGDAPIRMGDDSVAVVGDLPADPGWIPGRGETMELLVVHPSTPLPGQALVDSSRYRMALRFEPFEGASARPVSAVAWKGGRLIVVRIDWKTRRVFVPSSVARLVVVPAVALDLALSPLYLVAGTVLWVSCSGSCFRN